MRIWWAMIVALVFGLAFAGVAAAQSLRDVEAGPIWNNGHAQAVCPSVCADAGGRWTGQWRTTEWGRMSVCGCESPLSRRPPLVRDGFGRGDVARDELVLCARENQVCRVPYPTDVFYGADGVFARRPVNRGIECSNRSFGDPTPGVAKRCYYRAATSDREPDFGFGFDEPRRRDDGERWVRCGAENQVCRLPYRTLVRYGARGVYAFREARGQLRCDNRTFGDPVPGVGKSCDFLAQ